MALPLFDLDLLRTFVAIAETGNFSAAAQSVFRTPSAVSMQVKKMEDIAGRPLFVRDSRSVTLTEDGEKVLAHGRRMLALNQGLMADFHQQHMEGTVRLAVPDDVAEGHLPDMLRRFARTHPSVTVNAMVMNTHPTLQGIAERRLDLGLITRLPFQRDQRPGELLGSEPLVWAGCRGGIAAEQEPLPVSVWEESCAWRMAGLGGLEKARRPYRIALESGHLSGQKAAVKADLAIAPIPKSALGGDIIEVPASLGLPPLPHFELCMVVRPDPPAAVEAAADHLRACFTQAALAA
ncbi:MAG: LysR substrate-binding domain-containing protein [Pseudomonadota bacterium]